MLNPARRKRGANQKLVCVADTLFFALPLVGWAMLSAGHYPIVMFGTFAPAADSPCDAAALRHIARDAHGTCLTSIHDLSRPCVRSVVPLTGLA
jgi:cytochrome b561